MAERTTAKDVVKKGITPTETTAEVNQTAQDLINQEGSTQKPKTLMVDPIAYRSDYNPNDIIEEYRNDPNIPGVGPQNANLNYNAYGDDSNPAWQGQRGGMNEKYTGEGVKNTYIDYNPDIKTSDLDPNYLYGEAARQQNRKEAGYIARRNDMIASALYNEGLVSKEDVARFLGSQNGWTNSTEEDRLNTIESVWKRLGQIQPKEEEKEYDQSIIENALNQDTSGKIYGKTTAEEGEPSEGISTLADANSVYKAMNDARIANVQQMLSMNSEAIGLLMSEGKSPFSETTMRDLQKYYPEKYQEIQTALKKIKGQNDVNNISSGGKMDVTSQLTASEGNVTTSLNTSVNKTASGSGVGQLSTNINNALADSEIVSGAREQMEVYKRKIQEIQDAANELPELANQYFKGDVPQYMVDAFVNNRMQQYNKEIEKYQNLYNASLQEAQMEIAQTQWREEMNYKWSSLQADQNYKNANLELSKKELEYNRQKAAIANGQWNDDGSYSYVDLDGNMHVLSADEAKKTLENLDNDLYNYASEYINTRSKKIETAKARGQYVHGGQCESFTDNFARQYFGTEMRGKNGGVTTAEEKAAYATEALPKRGFIAVRDYGIKQADGVNYGHTGIVIDYDHKTGTFTTIESNYGGHGEVSIRQHSINASNLMGFRDPSQGESAKGKTNGGSYYYYDTPMLQIFTDAYNSAQTAGVRTNIDLARESYSILNELNDGGYIDALVNSEVLDTVMTNIKNRNFVDNDGNIVWDTIKQAAVNETQDPDMAYAIDRIHRLVEIKLRKESGAAINISEWLGNFDMYMPQVGQDSDYKLKRLQSLEHDMVSGLLPTPYVADYVPIIATEKIKSYKKRLDEAHDELKDKVNGNK